MNHQVVEVNLGIPAPALPTTRPAPAPPQPPPAPKRRGDPNILLVTGHRRSGTTWLAAMLNAHPALHVRNEGWLFNDIPLDPNPKAPTRRWCDPETRTEASFEQWFDLERFESWANRREAKGTWLRDMTLEDAALVVQRGMFMALLREATFRQKWKDWDNLAYIGDKTTIFYLTKIEAVHRLFPPPDNRIISLIRDGRDSVVSNMFLLFREKRIHELPRPAREPARRAYAFHVEGKGDPVPLFSPEAIVHFTNEWLQSVVGGERAKALYGPSFLELRYEDMVADERATLMRCYDFLGVASSKNQIDTIIDQCKFERFSEGRRRGEENPLAEFRKGIIGDWRNYFTQDDKAAFKRVAGATLIELGYEASMSW